jgi:hypothetical protein
MKVETAGELFGVESRQNARNVAAIRPGKREFGYYAAGVGGSGAGLLFAVAFEPRMGKLRSLSSDYCYRY